MELSIVVPCYNEVQNLDRLVSAFRDAIQSRTGIEIILVDNGSVDGTSSKLEEILARPENHALRSVRVEVNKGYGHGIMFGLHHARGRFVAWTHADLQTPPLDVLRALDQIHAMEHPENSLVRGKRKGRPLFDRFFTSAMSWVASALLGSPLYDINAQPKLFHRSLLPRMDRAPDDFTLDLYLLHLAHRLKLDLKTVDVEFESRFAGDSKGGGTLAGKYRLSKRTLLQIWKLRCHLILETSNTPHTVQPPNTPSKNQSKHAA